MDWRGVAARVAAGTGLKAARTWLLRRIPIAWHPDSTDIFCGPGARAVNLNKAVLMRTPHFQVIANIKPVAPGALLIIPRWHIPVLGTLPPQWAPELERVQQRVSDFFRDTYGRQAIFYENDVVWQTVHHAHLHAVPLPQAGTTIPPIPGEIPAPRWSDVRAYCNRGQGRYQLIQVGTDRRLYPGGTSAAFAALGWTARALGVPREPSGRWIRNEDPASVAETQQRFRDWLSRNPEVGTGLAAA